MTLRLLVADDSVTIQKIVTLAFSGEDAVIESASDGNSALESARSFKPDIILADIFMPGCSGYDVCARIKDDPLLSETPVILLVGTFEPYDEKEASRVKSDACLTKPFDTSELIRTVRTLVQRRETKQGNQNPQKLTVPPKPRLRHAGKKKLVSPAAWESFLGEKRVLDVFDTESLRGAGDPGFGPETAVEMHLSEKSIDMIVDRVVRKISSDVIREVAWEVVPELSESIIRRTIQERE